MAPPHLSVLQLLQRGLGAFNAGRYDEAHAAFATVLKREPRNADANHLAGLVALRQSRAGAAVAAITRAVEINPREPSFRANLAVALKAAGRRDEALAALREAIRIAPTNVQAHVILGNTLREDGELEDAAAAYRAALALVPDAPTILNNLGNVERELGRYDEAIAIYRRAIAVASDYPEALSNLGAAEVARGHYADAVEVLERAIKLQPDNVGACHNLGNAFSHLHRYRDAEAAYRAALAINPGFMESFGGLGDALLKRGRVKEAVDAYSKALDLRPDDASMTSGLLFVSNYLEIENPHAITGRARRYGQILERRAVPTFGNNRDPDRRLKVGLVSGDLANHVVAHFLRGVIPAIDASQIELHAYATSAIRDADTDRFKQHIPQWRDAELWTNAQFIEHVQHDAIDILVDLHGHTQYSRLPVFALKPAPIQVTWLGYSGTSGVAEIDYVLGDARVTPPGEEDQLIERPWRMPDSYLCYTPTTDDIPVAPSPALTNGYVTFGSLNNILKLSDPAIALWSRVLAAVPDSRLVVKAMALSDPVTFEETQARFVQHGIPLDRLTLLGLAKGNDGHLGTYNQIDIALDAFPYNGTTTTAEALWMGVPVLGLRGDRFIAHVGESLLTSAGMPDWIADDRDDFVARAVAFAADIPALGARRPRQRAQIVASPLCDAPRFARNLEAAFRGMWREWCVAQGD